VADHINFRLEITKSERDSIQFRIGSNGEACIAAAATQFFGPSPSEIFPERVSGARVWIWVHTLESAKGDLYFQNRAKRIEKAQKDSPNICCMAVFNSIDPGGDLIEFTAVVPNDLFSSIKRFFELMWLKNDDYEDSLRISITSAKKIRTRFSEPTSLSDQPFTKEFLRGHPIFFNEINLILSRRSILEEPRSVLSSQLPGHSISPDD
jgi:hypothetical protein